MEYRPCALCCKRIPIPLLGPSGLCLRCADRAATAPPPSGPVRCANCARMFTPSRAWARFCSPACGKAHHHKSSAELLEAAARALLEKDNRIRDLEAALEELRREAGRAGAGAGASTIHHPASTFIHGPGAFP